MTKDSILRALDPIVELLLSKNASYGDAYKETCPLTKLPPDVALKVRIGDKVRRLSLGREYGQEDTLTDLLGYLVLLRVLENESS